MGRGLPPSIKLVGIGFYIAITIALGTVLGRELDQAMDTEPVFTIAGLALGLVAALYGGLRQLMGVLDEMNRRRSGGE